MTFEARPWLSARGGKRMQDRVPHRLSRQWWLAGMLFAWTLVLPDVNRAAMPLPFTGLLALDGVALRQPPRIGDGEWTLVVLWASDCHVCKAQKPMLSALHARRAATGVTVLGIALDGREGLPEVRRYLAVHRAEFPNYVGEYPIVAVEFQKLLDGGLRGTPTYVLFDPAGEPVATQVGPITTDAVLDVVAARE